MSYSKKKKELVKKVRANSAIHGPDKATREGMDRMNAGHELKKAQDSIPKFLRRDNKK